jgi:hypothetical protein
MLKKLLILILLLIPSLSFAYECNKEIDSISKQYKIKIICNTEQIPNGFIRNVSGKTITRNYLLDDFYPLLKTFLEIYPKQFLQKRIQFIGLFEDLTLDGNFVGGLTNGKHIYIRIGDYGSKTSKFYLMALNHEFSSNVFKTATFHKIYSWNKLSEKYYDRSNEFFLKNVKNYDFSRQNNSTILSQGFVFFYGKTDEENDFNTYAECLFRNDLNLKLYSNKYPIIKQKLDLLKEFYREAGFTGNFPDET